MTLVPSGEAIAAVVSDLRRHRVKPTIPIAQVSALMGPKGALAGDPVVDATSIFRSLVNEGKDFDLYGNNVAPPWASAAIGFQTIYGAAIVVDLFVSRPESVEQWQPGDIDDTMHGTHAIEWDRVESVLHATLWLGGRSSAGAPITTTGPFHGWKIPIYPGGEMADVRWQQLKAVDEEVTNSALTVLLATFNFLNCRNVHLVEPHRPRAMQRRIGRFGFQVSELSVSPLGRTTRSEPSGNTITLPLHSVRGHFAEYGTNGKGLLFGKYDGRFWIPQHARGSVEVGVVAQEFTTVGRFDDV